MTVQLQRDDFRQLVRIVQTLPGFDNPRDRRLRVISALQNEPGAAPLLASLSLDGPPDLAATELINHLARFGQFSAGREALGVFLNAILDLIGVDKDAAFIHSLFDRYSLGTFAGEHPEPVQKPASLKVFVSYSHQDDEYLADNSLLGFLKGLEKDGVEFWTDRKIRPGEKWDQVIKENIQSAPIALVLVSQAFLDSAYCQDVEIEGFLAGKAHLIPIILSPCEWRRHRWLSERQFLPGGNETIEEHYTDSGRRKALFLKIREALRERVELIRRSEPVPAGPAGTAVAQPAATVAPAVSNGRLSGPKRLEFCRRLGDDWRHLAAYLEIPASDQARFGRGDEARAILIWLENRKRLPELQEALSAIGRQDLH